METTTKQQWGMSEAELGVAKQAVIRRVYSKGEVVFRGCGGQTARFTSWRAELASPRAAETGKKSPHFRVGIDHPGARSQQHWQVILQPARPDMPRPRQFP
jgi:hypothetical protein